MKKSLFAIAIITMLLTACSKTEDATINQNGANVFPSSSMDASEPITMGDVMPFYDDGVMNIYHLRNTTGTNSLFYHPIARLATEDFIHYTDEGIALNYEENILSVDAALGTGSFIKDKDGLYHCFYTGHNDKGTEPEMGDNRLPYIEVIRHATSVDQKEWTKDEDFKLYGGFNDFRDPYVYFDSVDNCYYMLVTTRHIVNDEFDNDVNLSVIRRYHSSSLSNPHTGWIQDDKDFFVNDEGSYNMECPSYVEYEGVYYLAYSEQGENRVTHYRYRTSHDGEWKKPNVDAIDSSGFYAGRLEKAGNKLYAFAWCARLTGGSTGSFDWAGNLVTHELRKNSNNELALSDLTPVMPTTYKDYFSHEVAYTNTKGERVENIAFNGEKFDSITLSKKSNNVTRLSMKIKVSDGLGDFGMTFGLNKQLDKRLGDGIISFDVPNSKIACFNNVSSIIRYGGELTNVKYDFKTNKEYLVDVVMCGEIISVYLNNEVALTCRLVNMTNNYFGFYSNKAKVSFEEVRFYE